MKPTLKLLTAGLLVCWGIAHAQVSVQNPWIRATVKGQMATGAFMTLTAKDGAKLVGGASPVAGVVQVHEMKMDNGVMKMAEVKGGLDLPAGQPLELKPGSYHVMLMDLKQPLENGSSVPLTLMLKDAKGQDTKMELTVPVKLPTPAPGIDHSGHPGMAMPAK
jgi:hypothetical protein